MTPDRILEKFIEYVHLEQSGQLTERFGIASARILTVSETAQRASALLGLIAQTRHPLFADMRDRFLFTSEEAYRSTPENVLAAIWRSAAKPEERNALIPSPLPRR